MLAQAVCSAAILIGSGGGKNFWMGREFLKEGEPDGRKFVAAQQPLELTRGSGETLPGKIWKMKPSYEPPHVKRDLTQCSRELRYTCSKFRNFI